METDELRAQVNSTRQDAVVDAEAELKPDEHDTVKRSMTDKPVGASTDPQVKAVKDGKTKKATALRQLFDKMHGQDIVMLSANTPRAS